MHAGRESESERGTVICVLWGLIWERIFVKSFWGCLSAVYIYSCVVHVAHRIVSETMRQVYDTLFCGRAHPGTHSTRRLVGPPSRPLCRRTLCAAPLCTAVHVSVAPRCWCRVGYWGAFLCRWLLFVRASTVLIRLSFVPASLRLLF